ncbi:hypothetical protein CSTERTH_09395 [Thermoclostridium stercorarium subsp. thermolacticum DSM 2910]|jgi:hypothetical protein|uniref:DUF4367 domain-containing protein n=1 Tax=Thermoclostridium stercorarium subsp. thermolacticum DSM 2910 TaxID=1121336 RepID=A0A1B1YEN1_THEST|nr:DUF4367 domain-containing protein [Thermoclostridium stercorarium]ANW99224.1 hypothetical protein CSTERTH_09395 [Thermoclostridium stercorarium subsp. thermolacticum DSM 2910]UZQ84903.1 DUF4367 domain-containing protein [Thermoclostridium stercorarium]
MVINFTDDMLKKAVIKADIYEIETLPADDEIEYEFSNEFKRKIKKLIRQNKTRSQVEAMAFLRMRVVVFVAAIIILLVSAMSVSAMRAAVFEFITEVNEKFTHIFFNESRSSQDAADGFAIYEPAYIPEGFKLVNKNTDGLVLLEYEKENDFISYSQQCLENVSSNINTEGVRLEELEFKGLPAKYYSNQGVQNLLWYDDKYIYVVSSTLDRDIVFKIAESVEITGADLCP